MEAATSLTGAGNRKRARVRSPRSTKVRGRETGRERRGGERHRTARGTGQLDIPSENEMNTEKERRGRNGG